MTQQDQEWSPEQNLRDDLDRVVGIYKKQGMTADNLASALEGIANNYRVQKRALVNVNKNEEKTS